MCLTQSHSINKQPSPSLHYLMRENKATFMVILTHRWHYKKYKRFTGQYQEQKQWDLKNFRFLLSLINEFSQKESLLKWFTHL